jgi:PAS domain S-box-containing protein
VTTTGTDLFKLLFDTVGDGLCVCDRDGRYVAANPGLHRLLGYAPGELVGRSIEEVVRSGDRGRLRADYAKSLLGEPHLEEWTLLRKDGSLVRTEVSTRRLPDGNVAGVIRDLSERERSDAGLRASEERLRATLDSTPEVAIQWYGVDGRVLFWNRASERLYGYSAREAVGRTLDELIQTKAEAAAFGEICRRVHETGRPYGPDEFDIRRRDGSRGVSLSTIFEIPGEGGAPWFVCMDVDITARKEAERALKDRETRLRSYFELPLVGLAITSLEKGWLEVNDRLCEMLGYPREELQKLTWAELTHPDDLAPDVAQFNRVLRGEIEGYSLEKRFVRKGGTVMHSFLSVRCARKADRSVDYFIALLQDVTEQKRLEENLRQYQKEESIGRLAGGVAHDFNNLLTSILGFADCAREGLAPESPAAKDIDRVIEAGKRGAALTQQLLAFARKKIVSPRLADLNVVIRRMEPLLRRLLGEDVALEVRPAPSLPPVRIDVGTFDQVLMNLAVNARDAMPSGGRLTIETAEVVLDAEYARLRPEVAAGRYVRVEVSDTGAGMTREVRERVFEPFFTTKPVGQGTGLGLAVVQGIVRQAGGHVVVDSEPGCGSRFRIFLPGVEGTPSDPEERPAAPSAASGAETLLVVEDDAPVLDLIRSVLVSRGYRVLAARDGEEALARAAAEKRIDLLITDVVMPGMDGADLARRLRSLRPGLRVLFASGYPEDAIAPHGVLEAGVDLIQKPYTPSTLAARVRAVLDRAQ